MRPYSITEGIAELFKGCGLDAEKARIRSVVMRIVNGNAQTQNADASISTDIIEVSGARFPTRIKLVLLPSSGGSSAFVLLSRGLASVYRFPSFLPLLGVRGITRGFQVGAPDKFLRPAGRQLPSRRVSALDTGVAEGGCR